MILAIRTPWNIKSKTNSSLPDVDTHEPDEKSLITYISSLYETFPEPPAVHPLFDAESQRRAASYTENAAIHRAWLHENCALMQVRIEDLLYHIDAKLSH